MESVGFAGLTAAMSVARDMNEVAAPGVTWIVTTHIDGAHVPAVVVGSGSGAAVLIAAGVYDVEDAGKLEPAA